MSRDPFFCFRVVSRLLQMSNAIVRDQKSKRKAGDQDAKDVKEKRAKSSKIDSTDKKEKKEPLFDKEISLWAQDEDETKRYINSHLRGKVGQSKFFQKIEKYLDHGTATTPEWIKFKWKGHQCRFEFDALWDFDWSNGVTFRSFKMSTIEIKPPKGGDVITSLSDEESSNLGILLHRMFRKNPDD